MPLIKDGSIVADPYIAVGADDALPQGDVIVTAERYLADPNAFAAREGRVGIIWPNNRRVDELAPYLEKLALVALVFPKYRDGRAYSQARILRERYDYDGEVRATGEVLRDQFLFFIRSGFDALDVKKDADAEAYADAVKRYSVFYQPASDGEVGALRARLGAGRALAGKSGAASIKREQVS